MKKENSILAVLGFFSQNIESRYFKSLMIKLCEHIFLKKMQI